MIATTVPTALCLATLLATPGNALAHPDDPKILDIMPPVIAEPYRADVNTRGEPSFDSLDVDLLSWLPVNTFGLGSDGAADIWGYTSPAGREYAIITLSNGISFVDVTEPGNAQIVRTFTGPDSLWHDVKVYDHYAYAVSEGGQGIRIYDMENIDSGQVTSQGTVTTGGTTATHNVAINTESGYLYRTGGDSNGLRIYSLANPATPEFVGQWSDRYVHDAQIKNFDTVTINGQLAFFREIAFCCSGFNGGSVDTGLTIVDVTNKSNPVVLSQTAYSSRAYSHQAWLSDDGKTLFLNDELDEQSFGSTTTTRVFDVSDLGNPVEVTTFTNGRSSIDHNLYIKDDLMYAANYRSGLRIFDVSDPMNAEEIGYFDTFPDSDSANFNGAWSVYPFFESGTVIVSDIERGLFVLRYNKRQLELASDTPETLLPSGQTIEVTIDEVNGGQLVTDSPTLVLGRGNGPETYPMTDLGSGVYRAAFPALECLSTVEYYFQATAENGSTATLPSNAASSGGYLATVATEQAVAISDDFDSPTGWTVGAPDDDASSGIWERVDPNPTSAQPGDALFGQFCFVTGQQPAGSSSDGANDVDNGQTTLISRTVDLTTAPNARYEISYWRWFSNAAGAGPNTDPFTVDISADNGENWVNVEVVAPDSPESNGGWFQHSFNPDDFIPRSSTVKLRFIASDDDPQSLVEAAIDGFRVSYYACEDASVPGDANGDGAVDLADLNMVLANFGQTTSDGDVTGDGSVDLADLNLVLAEFGN
ncbi:MAG: choice-of-anchor B family protein [Phycisphaerales bacterium JB065]